jgi:hypothetical protein
MAQTVYSPMLVVETGVPSRRMSKNRFSFQDVPVWVYLAGLLFALVMFVLYFHVD